MVQAAPRDLVMKKNHIDNTLNFASCVISDKGVLPDPDRISALSKFPVPTDQTGVRSFLEHDKDDKPFF